MKSIKYFKLVLLMLFFATASCEFDNIEPDKEAKRGDIISYTSISQFSVEQLNSFLIIANLSGYVEPEYPVEFVSVVYNTIDAKGEMTQASGALFIPVGATQVPFMSFQHGTQTKRTEVASLKGMQSLEGLAGTIAASIGYISCVPDFLGLGQSDMLHPYLHSATSASCVIDLLEAAKNYCEQSAILFINDLYIGGYSEGGFVTMAAQKELEKGSDFKIKASAPMAGPYDLLGTVDSIFQYGEYPIPANATFLALAYNDTYNITALENIFNEPYLSKIPSLFDGSQTISVINTELTTDLSLLFTPAFLNEMITTEGSEFRNVLALYLRKEVITLEKALQLQETAESIPTYNSHILPSLHSSLSNHL